MAAFQVFLYGRFWVFTEVVIDRIFQILKQGVPYDYVEGQLWQLIASIGTPKDLRRLMGAFKKRSKKRDRMALEMGLIAFAAASTRAGLYSRPALARRINLSDGYLQSTVIPFLAEKEFSRQGLIGTLLQKPHAEPGLVIVPRLVVRNLSHSSYGIQPEQLAPQVRNALGNL